MSIDLVKTSKPSLSITDEVFENVLRKRIPDCLAPVINQCINYIDARLSKSGIPADVYIVGGYLRDLLIHNRDSILIECKNYSDLFISLNIKNKSYRKFYPTRDVDLFIEGNYKTENFVNIFANNIVSINSNGEIKIVFGGIVFDILSSSGSGQNTKECLNNFNYNCSTIAFCPTNPAVRSIFYKDYLLDGNLRQINLPYLVTQNMDQFCIVFAYLAYNLYHKKQDGFYPMIDPSLAYKFFIAINNRFLCKKEFIKMSIRYLIENKNISSKKAKLYISNLLEAL